MIPGWLHTALACVCIALLLLGCVGAVAQIVENKYEKLTPKRASAGRDMLTLLLCIVLILALAPSQP